MLCKKITKNKKNIKIKKIKKILKNNECFDVLIFLFESLGLVLGFTMFHNLIILSQDPLARLSPSKLTLKT